MEKPLHFIMAVALAAALLLTCSIMANTIDEDARALSAFKSTIISDPFQVITTNWSSHTSPCHWFGVSCAPRHQRVTALNLSGLLLSGTIPPSLVNLTFLTSLDLHSNNFTESLPLHLSSLRRLQLFNVGYNLLSGHIPSSLGSLPHLTSVIMNNNSFTGTIPTTFGSNNSRLRILWLRNNYITGNIPQQIANLTSLESLNLGHNSITGSIPHAIFNISSIQEIDLTGNALSGTLPEDLCSTGVPNLIRLYLWKNLLSGKIPFNIYNCTELKYLVLSNNHFNGSIPKSVGWMTKIETLYLGVNDFHGVIPMELHNLSRLQILSFPSASLIGPIPPFIFNMSSVKMIDLWNNSFSGSIAESMCSNLPNLQNLDLSFNILKGDILEKIWNCNSLSFLNLDGNEFTGNIPKHLGNLTELRILYLAHNKFTGELPFELGRLNPVETSVAHNSLSGPIPPSLFNISTMEALVLSDNFFSGQLPLTTGLSLPNLKDLHLFSNMLSGGIPPSISNLSNLAILSISGNLFTGPFPNLGGLRMLQVLEIAGNSLTGVSPNQELSFLSWLTNCRELSVLFVSSNPLDGILPASIGNLSSSLQVFGAFGCRIRGSIPLEIGDLTNLQHLDASYNELIGSIPTTIGVRVNLKHNKLEGNLPTEFCLLRRMAEMYVSSNALHGPVPECFGEVKSLQRLFLDSNKFESNLPSNLWDLSNLVSLNLSTNMLNGSLPTAIGNLQVVENLDLSWNQFSGEIPSSLGKAASLVNLTLDHNNFHGSIPESLGSLKGLESLDLSLNSFSGVIPKTLEGLTFLQYFNVSYNRLEGQIPTGGKFSNFTSQSFMKNYALCGAARLLVPPCEKNLKNMSLVKLVKYIVPPFLLVVIVVAIIIVLMRKRKAEGEASGKRRLYQELVLATNDFSDGNLLGSGSYGSVFLGTLYGATVAVKVFNLESENAARSFNTEVDVLLAIRHRNLIKIIGFCSNPDFIALVLEYMPRGSLERWLYSHNHFLYLAQRLNIAIDVAHALEHLHLDHTFPIVHCDLKPSNVLLDEDMAARVCDFGIAKLFGEGERMVQTRTLATIGYMAPEYGAEGIVSTSCDIYSFGVMLLELCTRRRPTDEMFGGELSLERWVQVSMMSENKMMDEVVDGNLFGEDDEDHLLLAKEQCVSSLLETGIECLASRPADRIDITQVVAN